MSIDLANANIDSFGRMDVFASAESRSHRVILPGLADLSIEVYLKREDEIHPEVSGNKWRKLQFNLQFMLSEGIGTLVTFGGAYSNHIAATAAACRMVGINSVGIIRGECITPLNPTLALARENGMTLHFLARDDYRNDKEGFARALMASTEYHLIPEGGANEFGVRGCEGILSDSELKEFEVIACAAGTGCTAAGILRSTIRQCQLRVYAALKGDFMRKDIKTLSQRSPSHDDLEVTDKFSFGGYAKTSKELFAFISSFFRTNNVKLDPIYTAKMMYGIVEDCKSGMISEGSKVLAIHTGGLQGVKGIELRDNVSLFEC